MLEHGGVGEVYNAGGPDECPNVEVIERIIELTGARVVVSEDAVKTVAAVSEQLRAAMASR